jgi:hypothetical protein
MLCDLCSEAAQITQHLLKVRGLGEKTTQQLLRKDTQGFLPGFIRKNNC